MAAGLFVLVVLVTLGITLWAGRRSRAAEDFYAGGREFSPLQNGFAISGDYMSAASFLGVTGLIALYGYDGLLYTIGFLVAWLVVLMLVAELVRNCGRYTLADVLSLRMRQRPVRAAAGISSIVVSLFYLLGQMVGAGSLVALLLHLHSSASRDWSIVGIGVLMVVYVTVGGMKATTWIQIVKCVLLLGGTLLLTVLVLVRFHGDLGTLMRSAAHGSGQGSAYLLPGLHFGHSLTDQLDFISLGLALVLGTGGLPHILARFYTVPTARAARRSAIWAIGLVGSFYLMTIVLGLGAAAVIGGPALRGANAAGNTAVPQLADAMGGTVLFALTSAVAFATILAVVAGLTLASSASFAHDLWARAFRHPGEPQPSERQEVVVARIAAVVIGAVAIVLSLYAQKLNVAVLVGIAFAVAASANLPALLFNLFWHRFTTRGATWAIYGGLVPCLALVVISPVVSGSAAAIFPSAHFDWFPLQNPGLVSVPCGFLFGWLGTVTSRGHADPDAYAELEVRALTGAGAA
ncbi:solute symporter family protein [Streptacidiphilus fuscans]|uniref:Cation acetate symporter n=1 Tax=Streptacidiphilus fuscans TaxID=2789292 RepID=A0A931BDR4_9ACTN|nr:cation acetate symporter [Streptacidiphilus fuscans]MBF9071580.1 cation acetate symporter [Streptacidiphilus fuscans]